MSPTPSPTNNHPPIHPIISMNNWWMRAFQVAILRPCLLGSHLCHGVIFLIISVLAELGKAADPMVELCVLWDQCIKIKVGTSISYKFLLYDAGNIWTIAAYNKKCIPKLALEILDLLLPATVLLPRLDNTWICSGPDHDLKTCSAILNL